MKWFKAGGLALILLAVGVAATWAADLPVRKAQAVPQVVQESWAGMYFGIHGGMNLGAFNPIFGSGEDATRVNFDDNSAIVGGHIGYYGQLGGFVIGPEIGIQYMGFKAKKEVPAVVDDGPTVATLQQKVDWMAYAGANVGVLFGEYILASVGGGVAWAHQKGEVVDVTALSPFNTTASLTGWYVRAGLEYKLSQRVRLGVDYKHVDFGDVQPVLGIDPKNMRFDQITGRISFSL